MNNQLIQNVTEFFFKKANKLFGTITPLCNVFTVTEWHPCFLNRDYPDIKNNKAGIFRYCNGARAMKFQWKQFCALNTGIFSS